MKNRPKFEGYFEESYEEYIARVDRWFRGFEAELRSYFVKGAPSPDYETLIKELLGE